MDEEGFRLWLIKRRQLAPKVAGDAISRCRWIEKRFHVSLDAALTSQLSLDRTHDQLLERGPGLGTIRYALRLYVAYKNPRLAVKPNVRGKRKK